MPINFKRLKEIIRGKPSTHAGQPKDYGENYQSPYQAQVAAKQQRSAPSVLQNIPQQAPMKEHKSEYAQTQMNQDREALKKKADKEREKKEKEEKEREKKEKEEKEKEKKRKAEQMKKAPTPVTPPTSFPAEKPKAAGQKTTDMIKAAAATVTSKPPPKLEPIPETAKPVYVPNVTPVKKQPAPTTSVPPPPAVQPEDIKANVGPAPLPKLPPKSPEPPKEKAKPAPTPPLEKAAPQAPPAPPVQKPTTPVRPEPKMQPSPPAKTLATPSPPQPPKQQAPPTAASAKEKDIPGTTQASPRRPSTPPVVIKRNSGQPPPITAKRNSSPPAQDNPKRTSGVEQPEPPRHSKNWPKIKRMSKIMFGSKSKSGAQQRRASTPKRQSLPEPLAGESPEESPTSPWENQRRMFGSNPAIELRKKPPEVSGYFAADPEEAEKRFYNVPNSYFFTDISKRRQSETETDLGSGPKEKVQRRRSNSLEPVEPPVKEKGRGGVKFDDNPKDEEHIAYMPKRRISVREGSMHIFNLTLTELPSPHSSHYLFEHLNVEDFLNDDEEPIDLDEQFRDAQRSSFSFAPDDSLQDIRRSPRVLLQESLEEYLSHRRNFWVLFSMYLIWLVGFYTLAIMYVFSYNHGFTIYTTQKENSTLYRHEVVRYNTNWHTLLMTTTRTGVFGFSCIIYRIFPCITRTKMKYVHGSIGIFGFLMTIIGLYFAIVIHNVSGIRHIYSLHAYLGLTSLVLSCASVVTGLIAVLPIFSWDTKVSVIPLHRQIAGCQYSSELATILTGVVNISKLFFNSKIYPGQYEHEYHVIHAKSIILNLMGISAIFTIAISFNIFHNYHFRRRRKPQALYILDPDNEAIEMVMEHRRSHARRVEEVESSREEDIQIGSKKSFNLRNKSAWNNPYEKEKTIPLLINENEKRKANFTDTDILLDLE